MYKVEAPKIEDDTDVFWLYYSVYKRLLKVNESLDEAIIYLKSKKEYLNNRNDLENKEERVNKIQELIDKIKEAQKEISETINLIPKDYRNYFKKRDEILEEEMGAVDLIDLMNNPDALEGLSECNNLTMAIQCTQNLRRTLCYAAGFAGQFEGFKNSIFGTARAKDDFVEQLKARLGSGESIANFGDAILSLGASLNEICGESFNDIRSFYNRMKRQEEKISESLASELASDCNGRDATIESNIDVKCRNGKLTITETLKTKLCRYGENIGILFDTVIDGSGGDLKISGIDKGTVDISAGKPYSLGKPENRPLSRTITIRWSGNPSTLESVCNIEKDSLKACIHKFFVNNLKYHFVTLEKEQVSKDGGSITIGYNVKEDLGTLYTSDYINRLIQKTNANSIAELCKLNPNIGTQGQEGQTNPKTGQDGQVDCSSLEEQNCKKNPDKCTWNGVNKSCIPKTQNQ